MKISPRRTQLCFDQLGDHPLLFYTAANEAGIEPEGGASRRQGLSRTGMLEPPLAFLPAITHGSDNNRQYPKPS